MQRYKIIRKHRPLFPFLLFISLDYGLVATRIAYLRQLTENHSDKSGKNRCIFGGGKKMRRKRGEIAVRTAHGVLMMVKQ